MLGALPNIFQNTPELLQFFRGGVKMKRLSLIVFLVCLMTSGAFAVTNDWLGSAGPVPPAGTGEWSASVNYWSLRALPVDTGLTADYVKVQTTKVCTLNSIAGNFGFNKVTVAGTTAELDITGGSIGIGNEFQVSDAGKTGTVTQTGGSVTTFQGNTAGKIEVGYKLNGVGYYTISDGSIGFSGSTNVGQIIVGGAGAAGAVGTFTVKGNAATINTDKFLVGTKDSTGAYPGTGTIAFELIDGGVSPINALSSVIIDPINAAASIANLVVSLNSGTAPNPIVLIKNASANPVTGVFDTVTLNGLAGYTLVYNYNADGGAIGNDIALIPEPTTLALLGLGSLIAMRRNRK
jgi:hypothetical protein